jgi:O-antigen/teichoic acid export membrane protein
VLYGLGEHRVIAVLRVVEGVIKIALSIVLVKLYGVIGVAIGTAIPHIIVVGWTLPQKLPRIFPIDLRAYYINVYGRPLAAAVPFFVAAWFVAAVVKPASLVVFFAAATACMIVYVVPVWLIALTPDERARILEGVLRKKQSGLGTAVRAGARTGG